MATLYFVIGPSSGWSDPTAAEIKAGQLAGGSSATASGSETARTDTGTQTFASPASGLSAGTSYKVAFVWSDGTNDSGVAVSAAAFTTATGITLAVTEAADSVSLTVTVNALLAATEAADSASITATVNASLSATEAADAASATATVNAALAATEDADVPSVTANATAALAATEAADSASITATVNASLAATEAADSASLTATVNAALAATEAEDEASLTAQADGSLSMATTEASDTASLTATANAALTATESADAASVTATVNAALSASEAADVALFEFAKDGTFSLEASEGADAASIAAEGQDLEPVNLGGGNGWRYNRPVRKAPKKRKAWELPYTYERAEAMLEAVASKPISAVEFEEKWAAEFKAIAAALTASIEMLESERKKAEVREAQRTLDELKSLASQFRAAKLEEDRKRRQREWNKANAGKVMELYVAYRRERIRRLVENVQ